MSYCINPNCSRPQNTDKTLFCQSCGSELLLEGSYRVARLLTDPHKPSGFGTIYEVDDGTTTKILKVLHNSHPKAVELFQQEAAVLSDLNHPGIPKVESDGYFIYFPRNGQQPLHCLVMEKIEGMNLEEYLTQRNNQPIGERAALRWLRQLVEILHQVHKQQYFHRDIKPPNIMLKPDGQLVLIDFGTAREVTQTFMQKVAGQQVTGIISAGYTPPEQMSGKAVPQSDFFALGRTFVYLLTGKTPDFFNENFRTGELIWRESASEISQGFADFIDYLMAPFPGNRPQSTQEIINIITRLENSSRTSKQKVTQNKQQTFNFNQNKQQGNLIYAGFWRRLFAYLIDSLILVILGTSLGYILGFTFPFLSHPLYRNSNTAAAENGAASGLVASIMGTFGGMGVLWFLLGFITASSSEGGPDITTTLLVISLDWAYFTVLETFSKQGTIGKMMFGIMIVDSNSNDIDFNKANLRYWSKGLSFLSLFIGFLIAGVNEKKQALHDIVAKTIVITKR